MALYKLTHKAVEDLSNIWDYTFETWSEEQADNYYNLLLESFQYIANNSELGRKYNSILEGIFGFKTKSHIIFFRKLTENSIEITRILHERMDLKNKINQ